MNAIKASIKGNVLIVEVPMTDPRPSATGKTLVVASTHGNVKTEVQVKGQPVIVGLNAYIKP